MKEFEPYSAFKRIDREESGFITAKKLNVYLREGGYREYSKDDLAFLVRYFDQDGDMKLDYHE
ncbi:MAG: EF-hand domain-containing protein [Candidatus Roizmanbacteria bacterium]